MVPMLEIIMRAMSMPQPDKLGSFQSQKCTRLENKIICIFAMYAVSMAVPDIEHFRVLTVTQQKRRNSHGIAELLHSAVYPEEKITIGSGLDAFPHRQVFAK